MNAYKATTEMAVDPYIAVREAYSDHRKASISDR
jgi:ABC-type transporter lipoprotein component MlaA